MRPLLVGAAAPLRRCGTGSTIPNLVITGAGPGNRVCLYGSQRVDLIADLAGAFATNEPSTGRLTPA